MDIDFENNVIQVSGEYKEKMNFLVFLRKMLYHDCKTMGCGFKQPVEDKLWCHVYREQLVGWVNINVSKIVAPNLCNHRSSNVSRSGLFFLPHLTSASILWCNEDFNKVNYENQICLS